MNDESEIRAYAVDFNHRLAILLRSGRSHVVKEVIYEEVNEHACIDPTLHIPYSAGQQLMDDLWKAGLRPTEGSGSAGSLKATENHLTDMRKIAFKQLDIT